jgi:hypothetical protein
MIEMKKYILIAMIAFFTVSCTEDVMDRINEDHENPPVDKVPARLQITDGIMSTAFSTTSGNYAWYCATYTEQIFGCGNNQLMKAELRQPLETSASTTYNNEWNSTYGNLLNLKQIIGKCSLEGGPDEGQDDIKGMAQVLFALNFGILTDLHGDISCFDALMGLGNMQPKVDKQEQIYKDCVMKNLDDAIINLKAAKVAKMKNAGSQDILFKNDLTKWIASAYALKARFLLHTAFKNTGVYADVLEAANEAIANGFEGMDLTVFDGDGSVNPWTAFFWSRLYSGSSKTVYDLMIARNDGRVDVYAADMFDTGLQIGTPGNETQARTTEVLNAPAWLDDGAASIHIMSKAELYFIIAEVQARLGQDYSNAFETAVSASFDDYSTFGDVGDATEYIESLADKLAADPLKEIMTQKYLSQCRDEQVEAYNDIRRCIAMNPTGESLIKLNNPMNTQNGQNYWPLRLPYGNSSVLANPAIKALYGNGSYIFSEKIWLFGGSR